MAESSALLLPHLPADFLWGAGTSAFQIEGAVREGGRGVSVWDTFVHTPGIVRDGSTADTACDHYHRWREDLDLLPELGLNAYRFSLSWARLQPDGSGALNPEGVSFYRRILDRLHEIDVTPVVTLFHWDLPQALQDAGGWPVRETADRFADYAARAAAALGDLVPMWVTVNEAWCIAINGYVTGSHAPGRRSWREGVAAVHHLNVAEALARQALGLTASGPALLLVDPHPATDRDEDVTAAVRSDIYNNRLFLDPLVSGRYGDDVHLLLDRYGLADRILPGDETLLSRRPALLGVNHYHRFEVSAGGTDPVLAATEAHSAPRVTTLGWSHRPDALEAVLTRVSRELPGVPLYVTENGASFADEVGPDGTVDDPARIGYLAGYLGAVDRARAAGVDVRGYFHWSLLDNFEWAEGFTQRFGLVHVDFDTQRRTPKASARWLHDVVGQHRGSRRPLMTGER